MKTAAITFACIAILFSAEAQHLHSKKIIITWVDSVAGDYSFNHEWSYASQGLINKYGQFICDGDCPGEICGMRDSTGKIYQDSIAAYYRKIDTTHLFHSIKCDAWCYEFGECDFIDVISNHDSTLHLATAINVATHCSLNLTIKNGICVPTIKLISIIRGGDAIYYCKTGYLKIDKLFWKKQILKGEFSFDFYHPENPKQKMFWKGNIYIDISKTSHTPIL